MTLHMRWIRTIPMITVMGIIFFLSHLPGSSLHLPPLPGVDKFGHTLLYAVLAASVLYAVSPAVAKSRPLFSGMGVVLFCLLYGISDEFHQSFVPGRDTSAGDLLADTLGAVLAVVVWGIWRARRQRGEV